MTTGQITSTEQRLAGIGRRIDLLFVEEVARRAACRPYLLGRTGGARNG